MSYWVDLLVRNKNSSVKILSTSIIKWATEFLISLKKSNFFDIADGPFFHRAFFVRNKFLSNIWPLKFAVLKI